MYEQINSLTLPLPFFVKRTYDTLQHILLLKKIIFF